MAPVSPLYQQIFWFHISAGEGSASEAVKADCARNCMYCICLPNRSVSGKEGVNGRGEGGVGVGGLLSYGLVLAEPNWFLRPIDKVYKYHNCGTYGGMSQVFSCPHKIEALSPYRMPIGD